MLCRPDAVSPHNAVSPQCCVALSQLKKESINDPRHTATEIQLDQVHSAVGATTSTLYVA